MKTVNCKTNKTIDELASMLVHKAAVIKDKEVIIKAQKNIMQLAGVPQIIIDNPTYFNTSSELTAADFIWASEELAKFDNSKRKSNSPKPLKEGLQKGSTNKKSKNNFKPAPPKPRRIETKS